MTRWISYSLVLTVSLLGIGVSLSAQAGKLPQAHPMLDPSLTKDAMHAIQIGIEWLEQNQQENGCWSSPAYPAVTALAVTAILNSPDILSSGKCPESASHGLALIVSSAQSDGCIYQPMEGVKGGGMPAYNTAISIMALADAGNPDYDSLIERGRKCLVDQQYLGDGEFKGGMGYDASTDRPYADLSNTMIAIQALRRTQPTDRTPNPASDLDWEAATQFVSRCQHLRETNSSEWVSDSTQERGGFVYHPSRSNAGEVESGDSEEGYLRSYGSMTYAGLLSLLYARVSPDDQRVKAAVDWISRRWTVDENPGMGEQGLYYNYHTMAKALNVYGEEILNLPGGRKVKWREELVRKLVSLQRIDPKTGLGYWQNDSNRWWENDPNLVTSYTLIALEIAVFGRSPGLSE